MKNTIFYNICINDSFLDVEVLITFLVEDDIDKDRIQGDRISILSLEKNLVSDPKLRDSRVVLPSS